MKQHSFFIKIITICFASLLFGSCIREDIAGNSPEANFESLWKIIDEQYCFLDYKHEEYGRTSTKCSRIW